MSRDAVSAEELHEALWSSTSTRPTPARGRRRRSRRGPAGSTSRQPTLPDAAFTLHVVNGIAQPVVRGHEGVPDLVVRGGSMDLAEIFWGDANPVSNYMQGAIKTQGRADDVMRLDAMAMFIFLGQ